jgi:MATE family multidrug resistance protein
LNETHTHSAEAAAFPDAAAFRISAPKQPDLQPLEPQRRDLVPEESLPWRHKPFPELVRLAWPIAISMLSYSTMTLVDTLFVGRLGADALAGVSVGGVFCFTLLCFGFGALRAVKVTVSQAVGGNRRRRIPGYLGAGLLIAAALGLANVVLGLSVSSQIERVTASAVSALHAEAYVNARVLGAPFALLAVALREARYGTGDSTSPMRAMLLANVVNIGLDYLFIVVLDGGVGGAGWASASAALVEPLVLLGALVASGDHRRLLAGGWARAWANVPRIWRLGIPMGLQMLLEVSAFALLTAIFASMSAVDVAAHQIGIQVIHFSFLPAFALGEAASVLAGQAVGAERDELVRRVARMTLAIAAAYTALCGLGLAVFGEAIARVFVSEELLVATTVDVFLVAAVFQVFDGANIVARCVLRGTGDVRFTAVVAVTIAWVVTPPLALALGYGLGYGVVGGWIGLCCEIVLSSAVLWWRLEKGGWKLAAARERTRAADEEPPSSRRGNTVGDKPSTVVA